MKKTALITGASMGIGKALAEKLLAHNYTVIGTNRSGSIDIQHPDFHAVNLDLSSEDSIENAHREIAGKFPQIDLLINNAGVGPDLRFPIPERRSYAATFQVNVTGTVFFTEAFLGLIPDGGKLLNISSKMGSIAGCSSSDSVAYRMSKTALNMYTKTLVNRLEGKISVAAIHPGWVQTTIMDSNIELAPLTPAQSAEGIFSFLSSEFKTGVFWDVEDEKKLEW
jgi:NAD(P)-dependent dehydrogenase (short-subunit alcohol dehydrogenase family)